MSELQKRLDRLVLRLDHMGLRVEESLADALLALREGDISAGEEVDRHDNVIDHEEVEIERECIRLLALYQPAAIDLRRICFIIKVNNDLERIADLAASMGRGVKHMVANEIVLEEYPTFDILAQNTLDLLGKTVRTLSSTEVNAARAVMSQDQEIDRLYGHFVREVLDTERQRSENVDAAMTLITLAKALERIGDHCTNVAEDIIFLATGDIIRHRTACHQAGETSG